MCDCTRVFAQTAALNGSHFLTSSTACEMEEKGKGPEMCEIDAERGGEEKFAEVADSLLFFFFFFTY